MKRRKSTKLRWIVIWKYELRYKQTTAQSSKFHLAIDNIIKTTNSELNSNWPVIQRTTLLSKCELHNLSECKTTYRANNIINTNSHQTRDNKEDTHPFVPLHLATQEDLGKDS